LAVTARLPSCSAAERREVSIIRAPRRIVGFVPSTPIARIVEPSSDQLATGLVVVGKAASFAVTARFPRRHQRFVFDEAKLRATRGVVGFVPPASITQAVDPSRN